MNIVKTPPCRGVAFTRSLVCEINSDEQDRKIKDFQISFEAVEDRILFDKEVSIGFLDYIQLDQLLENIEKKFIVASLLENNNNKNEAAEKLGISFRALRYKIDKFKIDENTIKDIPFLTKSPKKYFDLLNNFNLEEILDDIEKRFITEVLKETNDDLTTASERLGINFRAMCYRVEKLKIDYHRL